MMKMIKRSMNKFMIKF